MQDWTLVSGSTKADFLEQNPELAFFPFVRNLVKANKDVNGIMWSLYLVEDPRSKLYHGMLKEERIKAVELEYGVNYENDCADLVIDYSKAAIGPNGRNYKMLNDSFQKDLMDLDQISVDKRPDFYAKLSSIAKGLEAFELKYKKELEETKANAPSVRGQQKPGMFFSKNNNTNAN